MNSQIPLVIFNLPIQGIMNAIYYLFFIKAIMGHIMMCLYDAMCIWHLTEKAKGECGRLPLHNGC